MKQKILSRKLIDRYFFN